MFTNSSPTSLKKSHARRIRNLARNRTRKNLLRRLAVESLEDRVLLAVYNFTAASFSALEGSAANTTNVVMLTRSDSSAAESVDVLLAAGATNPATAASDFTAGPITVNFGVGATTVAVPIQLLGDSTVELDEKIGLAMTNFSNGGVVGTANPTSQLTINNDDVATVSISNATAVLETNTGTPQLVFNVMLNNAVDVPVNVNFFTQNDTAKASDNDYVGQAGTLNFSGAAGQTLQVTVNVTGDLKVELNEQLFVAINNVQAQGR